MIFGFEFPQWQQRLLLLPFACALLAACTGQAPEGPPKEGPSLQSTPTPRLIEGRYELHPYGSEGQNYVLMLGAPSLKPKRFHLESAFLSGNRGRTLAIIGTYTLSHRVLFLSGHRMQENTWDDAIGLGGTKEWATDPIIVATLSKDRATITLRAFGRDLTLKRVP